MRKMILTMLTLLCIIVCNTQSDDQPDESYKKLRQGLGKVWKVKPLSI